MWCHNLLQTAANLVVSDRLNAADLTMYVGYRHQWEAGDIAMPEEAEKLVGEMSLLELTILSKPAFLSLVTSLKASASQSHPSACSEQQQTEGIHTLQRGPVGMYDCPCPKELLDALSGQPGICVRWEIGR